jgi:DNA invertase Pin-like site-specific DNA recombinase
MKKAALYVRVSTAEQTTENQLLDLRRYAGERGWSVFAEFSDHGVSGAKASRPALDQLMDAARKRKFDVLLVWRFDRFARSVKHLVLALEELKALGVDFISYQENVDTSSALGQAIFTIIAAMGALERDIIVERVHAGLRRARQQGKTLGRPRRPVDAAKIESLRRSGLSQRQIAQRLSIPKTTVARLLRGAPITLAKASP